MSSYLDLVSLDPVVSLTVVMPIRAEDEEEDEDLEEVEEDVEEQIEPIEQVDDFDEDDFDDEFDDDFEEEFDDDDLGGDVAEEELKESDDVDPEDAEFDED